MAPFLFLLLFISGAASDLIEVTVDPGGDFILPCQAADSSIRAVEWTRPDLEPEYVLVYRDGHMDTTDQHSSFKDRVELVDRDLKDGDVSLILKNVSRHDNGTYECRVKTNDTDQIRTISIIRLQVIDSDLPMVTVDPRHDVILPCQAADSSITAVKWTRPDLEPDIVLLYRDGHLNTTHQNPFFKDRVELVDRELKGRDASLILKNVSRHDNGTYKCRVKTGDTDLISIISLQVSGMIVVTVDPGDNATLPCQAPDSSISVVMWTRPDLKPDIVLYYSDGHLDTDHQHPSFKDRVELVDRDPKDGDASLTLKNVNINDTGTYVCLVKTDGSTRKKRDTNSDLTLTTRTVRLLVPDQILVKVHPGDDVILPCRADDSSIRVVEWTRADLEPDIILVYSDGCLNTTHQHPSFKDRVELVNRDLKDGDVSLILKNVRSYDAGTYECRVKPNDTDPIRSIRIIRLQVPDLIDITVDPGDDVILPCQADDSSISVVKWSRPDLKPDIVLYYSGGHLDTDHQHPSFKDRVELVDRDLKDGNVSLILKNVTRHDAGTYECRIKTDGSTRKKRGIDPIRTIHLQVPDPGSMVLIYVAVAAGVILFFVSIVVVGVLIRCKRCKNNRSGRPAADEASTDQLLDNPQCSLPLTVFSCPCTT